MKKRKNNRKLHIQRLQNRELMAGDVDLVKGVLEIDGTSRADRAIVKDTGSYLRVTLNGKSQSFRESSVSKIVFRGFQGNDYFNNQTKVRSSAYGHAGHDRLYGGSGNDYLSGGSGNDRVYGRGGNDRVRGNGGNDYLSGGSGHDTVEGHTGRDKMYGGSGNDKMYGGDQNDTMHGNSGNDRMYGQRGNDTMHGGSGNDYMAGYVGNDLMFGDSGNDTVRGNAGNDRLFGGDGVDNIVGGSGHDALHGGGLHSVDKLWGESGRDRFLTQGRDRIMDGNGLRSRNGDDVQIKFVNDGQSWSNGEIEVVDRAFADLFAARNANDLLRDTYTTAPLQFKQKKINALGLNTAFSRQRRECTTRGPWWNQKQYCNYRTQYLRHEITLPSWNESDARKNRQVMATVYHEIGHNFDNESRHFNSFKKISGWVQNPGSKRGLHRGRHFGTSRIDNRGWYRKSNSRSDFARNYGGYNPYEDFATAFEHYFKNNRTTRAGDAQLAAKLRLVDQVIRDA